MKYYLILIAAGLITSLAACDKIEDVNRTVSISVLHPPDIAYHIDLGLNEAQSIANWDTIGNVVVAFEASVDDALLYDLSTSAMGCGLRISVNGVEKLTVDVSGQVQNGASGFLIID